MSTPFISWFGWAITEDLCWRKYLKNSFTQSLSFGALNLSQSRRWILSSLPRFNSTRNGETEESAFLVPFCIIILGGKFIALFLSLCTFWWCNCTGIEHHDKTSDGFQQKKQFCSISEKRDFSLFQGDAVAYRAYAFCTYDKCVTWKWRNTCTSKIDFWENQDLIICINLLFSFGFLA